MDGMGGCIVYSIVWGRGAVLFKLTKDLCGKGIVLLTLHLTTCTWVGAPGLHLILTGSTCTCRKYWCTGASMRTHMLGG
jgi:hypothetical protein